MSVFQDVRDQISGMRNLLPGMAQDMVASLKDLKKPLSKVTKIVKGVSSIVEIMDEALDATLTDEQVKERLEKFIVNYYNDLLTRSNEILDVAEFLVSRRPKIAEAIKGFYELLKVKSDSSLN